MEYNECKVCGANNGRAGMLIGNSSKGLSEACLNCHYTRKTGKLVIHSSLSRTDKEIEKTVELLNINNKGGAVKGKRYR